MRNATISLALIIRNVEKTIEKCLSTFKECVDEIVIVDTGSTDNSLEIVKKFTDKIYHFTWINDFSAARNVSFEKCTKDFLMWCFPPGTVVHTEEGLVPIEQINIGDRVLTHNGIYKKVIRVYEQDYNKKDPIYEFETPFSIGSIQATSNHEFYSSKGVSCRTGIKFCAPTCRKQWSKRYLKTSGNICRQCKQPYRDYSFKYHPISELAEGDILAYPRLKQTIFEPLFVDIPRKKKSLKEIPESVEITPDFMRLIGYYVAEGTTNGNSFNFCFNESERDYHLDVFTLMKQIFNIDGKLLIPKKGSAQVHYNSVILSDFFYSILNGKQNTRCLPSAWLGLSNNHIAQFLKGYYRGDGGDSSDSFNFTSVSLKLITQVKTMLTRFGIMPNQTSYKIQSGNTAWRIAIGGDSKDLFEKIVGEKHPWIPDNPLRRNKFYYYDENYIYYPIIKMRKIPYRGKVYNLEVLDDHTYVIDNALCHNCDGDDYILPADIKKVNELDYTDKEIIICNYEYAHDEFGKSISTVPRERILKRSLGLKWQGRIHECLPLNGKLHISDISTHHNKQHGTSERNLAILEQVVQEDSKPRDIYYLAKEYSEIGRNDDAIKYFEIFIQRKEGFWEDFYQAYYRLANVYLNKGDDEKFKENIFKSLAIEERWAEPYNLLGIFYMNKQQWDKAIFWYESALNVRRPKELLAFYQPEYYTWLPCLQLCVCYNNIGNIEKAYEYNKKCLEYRPQDSRALNNDKILKEAIEKKGSNKAERKNGQGKKLNLGCGNKPYQDYVNVDIFPGPIVNEIFPFDEIPYENETISAIHSEHALEHVPFRRAEKTLKEWARVLKPQGELILKIPDFEECCRSYVGAQSEYDRWWFKATIYGIQESQAGEPDEAQIHKCGFSKDEIVKVLDRFGFVTDYIKGYDGYRTPSIEVRAFKGTNPKKVAWIAPENWEAAQTRIRVLNINKWLQSQNYQSKIVGSYNDVLNNNFDVAIVGKSISLEDVEGIKMLREKGKIVIGDFCEDLFEFPYFNDVVKACDKVVCCSHKLAEKCSAYNKSVTVIEDAWE